MKNIVFIPNISTGDGRNSPYEYSIKSWQKWCDSNDVLLIEWKDPITDPSIMKVTLQRYWVHDILQYNGIEYDQVLIVDADTIIHPQAPNFFKETEGKFAVVLNNGCYEWVTRSISEWGRALFADQQKVKPWEYFNGGFQITNKKHIPFYNEVKNFYQNNLQQISTLTEKIKAGTDQTIINYLAQKHKVDIKFLPECYNLQDLFRKNLLHIPGHSWTKDKLHYLDAGWVYHFNAIPQNERHVSYWMERTYKELSNLNEVPKYSPISLEYFLNMEVANGGISKQILNLNGKLKTIREIVDYWKTASTPELRPDNWQYYNCMIAGFRKNVANHHDLGWENMTLDYYESLEKMSDDEIENYLQNNPVEFDNGFIKHSYHRAYAMIGRLIRGEKYLPFYMETKKIYDTPTKIDGIHRSRPLSERLRLLKQLDTMGVDRKDYCLTQSSILSIMGIRDNDDLDIIISTNLRKQNIQFPAGIEVFPENYDKFKMFGANGDDDILSSYCINIDGYNFLEPRFYFARKNLDKTQRDLGDWQKIQEFFDKGLYQGYPFNFEFYKWGVLPPNRIKLDDLNLKKFKVVIDKYSREVNGINQGRAVYYDESSDAYIKIFNKDYCRLQNFKKAINKQLYIGIAPALTSLIYEDGELVGYICKKGIPVAQNDYEIEKIPQWFLQTVAKNCKQRGLLYYDLVPQNVIKLENGQYSLIDLESVYEFNEIDLMRSHNAVIKPANLVEIVARV